MTAPHWPGRYNDMPTNYERISEDEFWRTFAGAEQHVDMATKYVINVKDGHPLYSKRLTMFLYHGNTAVGFVNRIERALPAKPKVFFRACVCKHHFQETKVGKHLHSYACTKCPYEYTVDSSG